MNIIIFVKISVQWKRKDSYICFLITSDAFNCSPLVRLENFVSNGLVWYGRVHMFEYLMMLPNCSSRQRFHDVSNDSSSLKRTHMKCMITTLSLLTISWGKQR
uniref:Uncharacterized protein n=1 Tax=Triticum urartu TaxID=4572 RepID=A0A8R7UTW0_TRIUA